MTPAQYKKWMAARYKHGGYMGGVEHPEHYVWRSMLARCNNPKTKSYHYYGGRGIKVCKRWLTYKNFLADMGPRPSVGASIDRINTNKGYSPNNCQWASRSQQQKNKTSTKTYTNGSFTGTLVECAEYLNVTKNCAFERWKLWGTFEKGVKWLLLKKG